MWYYFLFYLQIFLLDGASGDLNLLFNVGADILNLFFLYNFFYNFPRAADAKIW